VHRKLILTDESDSGDDEVTNMGTDEETGQPIWVMLTDKSDDDFRCDIESDESSSRREN